MVRLKNKLQFFEQLLSVKQPPFVTSTEGGCWYPESVQKVKESMILAELENHKGMPIIGDKNGSTNFTEEKMKFAFLMVGNFDCEVDRATTHHA